MNRTVVTLISCLFITGVYAQDKSFRPTYTYEGHIQRSLQKLPIHLSFLVLLDSTVVGSYWYKPNQGSLRLTGKMSQDNTVLYERDAKDEITGVFKGKAAADRISLTGQWTSPKTKESYPFSLKIIISMKSFWDYIRKFRGLHEYNDIDLAIKDADKVLSVDVANQNISYLPKQFNKLHHVLSVNLLGNTFKSFPEVLTELIQLQEISLSSNELVHVTAKLGKLTNLRILIMNNNRLTQLPKELGLLSNLLYLELGNNKLTELPSTITGLKQLQELHLERNAFSEAEKAKIKRQLPNCVVHF